MVWFYSIFPQLNFSLIAIFRLDPKLPFFLIFIIMPFGYGVKLGVYLGKLPTLKIICPCAYELLFISPCICPTSVFFVVLKHSLILISIGVSQSAKSRYNISLELALVILMNWRFSQLPLSMFSVFFKLTLIIVPIWIYQFSCSI